MINPTQKQKKKQSTCEKQKKLKKNKFWDYINIYCYKKLIYLFFKFRYNVMFNIFEYKKVKNLLWFTVLCFKIKIRNENDFMDLGW